MHTPKQTTCCDFTHLFYCGFQDTATDNHYVFCATGARSCALQEAAIGPSTECVICTLLGQPSIAGKSFPQLSHAVQSVHFGHLSYACTTPLSNCVAVRAQGTLYSKEVWNTDPDHLSLLQNDYMVRLG